MSISAINGISLYEYYYKINNRNKKKENLAVEDEPQQNPNIVKEDENKNPQSTDIPPTARPWADIMYQLNISFNEDPKDDIKAIKRKLASLTAGLADKELDSEVKDLENHIDKLYVEFKQISHNGVNSSPTALVDELMTLSIQNQARL